MTVGLPTTQSKMKIPSTMPPPINLNDLVDSTVVATSEVFDTKSFVWTSSTASQWMSSAAHATIPAKTQINRQRMQSYQAKSAIRLHISNTFWQLLLDPTKTLIIYNTCLYEGGNFASAWSKSCMENKIPYAAPALCVCVCVCGIRVFLSHLGPWLLIEPLQSAVWFRIGRTWLLGCFFPSQRRQDIGRPATVSFANFVQQES